MPETPGIWNKETEYILDLTKNYHNLLQKEDGNTQSYIRDNSMLFMEENVEGYSYLTDMQGSTMRLLDHSGQTSVSYGYDEFGADLFGKQGQFQPFGYTGYQRDTVSGTYYAQAREYDAWSGRFTNEDVIKGHAAYPETLNAYGYCWGNPLKYVDRDGAFPKMSFTDTARDVVDTVKEKASDAVEWAQKVWTQDIVGEDTVYVADEINGASYEVSTHKDGNIITVKKDEYNNFKGWSVNAKVKFGDTGASASAKLSGTGLDPRKWKYSETFKYTDKETGLSKGVGRYADAKGSGYSISTSGTSGNMPFPLPNGTQIDDFESLNWSLSYSGEITNWKNLLEAVATAAAIAGLIALLAWLAGNDLTGGGVADDVAIPGVIAVLKNLVANFGQCLPQLANNAACGLE